MYWLPSIAYAHATLVSVSTGKTPMEVDTGRRPIPRLWATSDPSVFLSEGQQIVEYAKEQLHKAQKRQKRFYDQGRLEVSFKESDFVYVRAKLLNKSMDNDDYDITKDPTKNKLFPH